MSLRGWVGSRTLLFKFGVLVFAGASLTAVVIFVTGTVSQKLSSGVAAINYAGQERYRTYELYFLFRKLVNEPQERTPTRETMRLKQAQFEKILHSLRAGDQSMGLQAPDDPTVAARFDKLERLYRRAVQPSLIAGLEAGDEEDLARSYETFGRVVPGFVSQADDAVTAYERSVISDADSLRRVQLGLGAVLVGGVAVSLLVLVRWILRPVRTVMEGMKEMTGGRLDLEIPVRSGDELGRLAEGFNLMSANLARRTADLERATEELRMLSITDGLTGLYNHRYFHETVARETERSRRYGSPLSVLVADIDHFKTYNDRNGHLAGDQALAEVGKVISGMVRSIDIVCRYGGEEFTVILPNTGVEPAHLVAEKIRSALEDHRFPGEGNLASGKLTLSIGCAELEAADEDYNRMLQAADQALYVAKESGRNQVKVAQPGT